jgi:hypothetical protein
MRILRSIGVAAAAIAIVLCALELVKYGESSRALESNRPATESLPALPATSLEASGLRRDEDPALAESEPVDITDAGTASAAEPADAPVGWPSFPQATRAFDAETVDPGWSDAAEARILSNLSLIANLGLLDVEAECRESLCRVRLLFPAGAQPIYALRRIFDFAREIGLQPLASEQDIDAGDLPVLRMFLRR